MTATWERLITQVFNGLLKVPDQTWQQPIIIVGAHQSGRLLATELGRASERAVLIDTVEELCRLASNIPAVEVIHGDATSVEVLRRAGAEHAGCVFAASTNDQFNLRVCQSTEMSFNSLRLIARVNEPANIVDFELM